MYEIYISQREYTFLKIDEFKKYEISSDTELVDSLKMNNIDVK